MSDVAAHASPDDTMPSGLIHRIELCLNNFCYVIENSFLLEGKGNTVNCMLLHFVTHIATLNHCVFSLLLVFPTMRGCLILSVDVCSPLAGSFNAWVCLRARHITFNL